MATASVVGTASLGGNLVATWGGWSASFADAVGSFTVDVRGRNVWQVFLGENDASGTTYQATQTRYTTAAAAGSSTSTTITIYYVGPVPTTGKFYIVSS